MPPDAQPRQRSLRGVCGEQGRLGEALLEVLHDHGRLGKHEAAVLLDHGDTAGGVLLVQPRRLVAEVDPDALVRDLLLGQDDAHPPDVRAALGVVERQHASMLDALRARDVSRLRVPVLGAFDLHRRGELGEQLRRGRELGGRGGRARERRISRGSAPVSRATTVGFAPRATASPGASSP